MAEATQTARIKGAILGGILVLGVGLLSIGILLRPVLVVSNLVTGALLGCVFAVIALGLNLVWGVTKVVNIAHGELITLGAYGAYWFNLWFAVNPLLVAPVDAAIGLAVGFAFYFGFLYRELKGKEQIGLQSEMVTLVSTFGLGLAVSNLALWLWDEHQHVGVPLSPEPVTVGFLSVDRGAIYVAVISVLIIYGTHLFLSRTFLGNGIRAFSQDISAAKLVGINPTFVAAIATALGFAITMAGGALLTLQVPTGINAYLGHLYAPISFVIVVLGGPGRMWGSLAGGLIVGILINVLQAFFSQPIAYAVAFALVIPVLLLYRYLGILQ